VILISHNPAKTSSRSPYTEPVLRSARTVAEYKRTETTQQQVVRGDHRGPVSKVPGPGGPRYEHGHRTEPLEAAAPRADASARTRALVDRRQVRRARLAADHRRPDHHRDRLPVAERPLPHRRQLRQPDRAVAPYAVDRDGRRFALLLGEIDLSIGFVSASRRAVALPARPTATSCRPPCVASRSAPASRSARFHGLIITKIGVPSFVVTLAGLLAWNGVVLLLIGSRGTVILQNDFVDRPRQRLHGPGPRLVLCRHHPRSTALIHLLRIRIARSGGLANDPIGSSCSGSAGLGRRAGDRDRRRQPGSRRPYVGHPRRRAVLTSRDLRPEPTRFGRHV
jgi:hypothetical protein